MKEQLKNLLGHEGKMISWSKSSYIKNKPKDMVLFNSRIYVKTDNDTAEYVWWGDLNVSENIDNLKELSKSLNKTIYVFTEHDSYYIETRFNPTITISNGQIEISGIYKDMYNYKNNEIIRK